MFSMTSGSVRGVLCGGSMSKLETFLKYWISVPLKQSNTTNFDLLMSGQRRVPRPSICSHRMRDLTGRRKTMNSSAGMSAPVESMSTVTTTLGLRIYRDPLRFDDAEQQAVDEKTVVGGARRRWQFFDGVAVERREVEAVTVADDFPGRIERTQARVNPQLSGRPFCLAHTLKSPALYNEKPNWGSLNAVY